MRLRYLLTGCMLLALVIVGLRAVHLDRAGRDAEALETEQTETQLIARDAVRLLELGQQYLLRPDPDAALQWYEAHAGLARAIRRDAAYAGAGVASSSPMPDMVDQLPAIFDSLSARENVGQREQIGDRLLDLTRRISDAAFARAAVLTEQRQAQSSRQRRDTLTAQLLLLALMAFLAGLIVYRVLIPIGRLRAAAQAIERGDLNARSALRGRDELALLSRAFDQMVESLRQRNESLLATNRRLERSEDFHAGAARIAGLGSWEIDLRTQQYLWSEQTRRIHEVDDDYEPNMERALSFYPLAARQELRTITEAAIERHQSWDLELPFITATGRHRWVRASGAADYEDGKPVRLAGAIQDVTERREIEQELRLATREAKAANAAKSAFLAKMSHAVRTPMNAAIGLGYLLRRTRLDNEQRELVDKLEQSNESLLGVIEDVLDLSRMESGELALAIRPFDLPQLITETAQQVRPQADRAGLALTAEIAPGLPPRVNGDRGRIRQVIVNLLNNAIRHTESGSVRLHVGHAARGDDAVTIKLCVEDTGVGIAPATLERLFTPLGAQQDSRALSQPIGTGLGLSMVKTLTELMAGEVSATSTPGKGTRFEVTLPFTLATEEVQPSSQARPFAVMLAAACPAARTQIDSAAHALGWDVEGVGSADELLRGVRERIGGSRPHEAVLLDSSLGSSETAVIVESLRADARANSLPIVLLVDADGLLPIQSQGRADSMLVKPADPAGLFNGVQVALAKQHADAGRLGRGSSLDRAGLVRLAGVHVLVVDDSVINQEVAQRILSGEGAHVSVAPDGEQAIALLRDAPQRYDVVLMDVQMPLLDGNMATRRIRGELGLGRLPVIALTAGALAIERKRSLEAGMDDVLTKPIDAAQMIDAVHRHVTLARGALLPVAPAGGLAEQPEDAADWPQLAGVDAALARERFGGDIDAFAASLSALLHGYAPVAAVQPLPAPGPQRVMLAERVHRLAAAAAALGASAVAARARAAENGLRRNQRDSECMLLLDALAASWQPLHEACDAWLQQRPPNWPSHAMSPPDGDHPALRAFAEQLRRHDPLAVDRFQPLSPLLRAWLSIPRYERLAAALGRLDFHAALETLAEPGAGERPATGH